MERTENKMQPGNRQRKADEARQFSEERTQLLDTIREMIDIEFERRGMADGGGSPPNARSPQGRGREPPGCPMPHRRSLWQRIRQLFTCRPI